MALQFTLRQLEYLVAVADCGSIALAAERVNVSSPSISTAISQLVTGSGLQLFIRRHAQGVSLTESGRQFTSLARDVLASAGQLRDRAADIAGKVAGRLGIGCLSTFAQARVTLHALAPHPMVLLDRPHSAAYFLSLFSAAGVQPDIVERTRDMGGMRAMVANGGRSAPLWRIADRWCPWWRMPIMGRKRPEFSRCSPL